MIAPISHPVLTPATPAPPSPSRRLSAEEMSKRQKSIAVSEFFYKNRHLLGFDNPRKALLTTIKEAVDNSLDACEEAGILPDVEVRITIVGEDRFRVSVTDNGPGIIPKNVGPVFGKLLYGSKFHRLKMSRGQQGIGISAAGMYAMMTTGSAVTVLTRTSPRKPAYYCELHIDTKKNEPHILREQERSDAPFEHGTQVTMELQARYQKGRASVDEYLEQTAVANPHAHITYYAPDGQLRIFARKVQQLPAEAREIKPHPYGVELGVLLKMLQDSDSPRLLDFLTDEFCEVRTATARRILKKSGLDEGLSPRSLGSDRAEQLFRAIQATGYYRLTPTALKDIVSAEPPEELSARLERLLGQEFPSESEFLEALSKTRPKGLDKASRERDEKLIARWRSRIVGHLQEEKLPNPPTDCLSPIGVRQVLEGLQGELRAEFCTAETREPAVYRGNPFQIEVGLAYGGDLLRLCKVEDCDPEGPPKFQALLYRFANRVPLQYQPSACITYKTIVEEVNWSSYGILHKRGSLPAEPMVILVHMASVWVPFTSESKEAIADYDDIREEIRKGVQECARRLRAYLRSKAIVREEGERRSKFFRYIKEVVTAVSRLTGESPEVLEKLDKDLHSIAQRKTERADAEFDQDGRRIRAAEEELLADGRTLIRDREIISHALGGGESSAGPLGMDLSEPDPSRLAAFPTTAPPNIAASTAAALTASVPAVATSTDSGGLPLIPGLAEPKPPESPQAVRAPRRRPRRG